MAKGKSYEISKQVVWEAYKRVKANRGVAGVDRQSLEDKPVRWGGDLTGLRRVTQVKTPRSVGGRDRESPGI